MTTSRSQTSDADETSDAVQESPTEETPQLNAYEIHSERTVLTEPGNTDAWIATDSAVTPPE